MPANARQLRGIFAQWVVLQAFKTFYFLLNELSPVTGPNSVTNCIKLSGANIGLVWNRLLHCPEQLLKALCFWNIYHSPPTKMQTSIMQPPIRK